MARQEVTAFDPGAISGWAICRNRRLVGCGYGPKVKFLSVPLSRRGKFIIERPRDYPGPRRKVNPNDLLTLDFFAGQLEALHRLAGCETSWVYPRTWKGNVPKPKRGEQYIIERRVLERLDEEELEVLMQAKSKRTDKIDHNMIDAIGIAFWEVDRW